MPAETQTRGLCSTCDNDPGCTFAANREKPAWHCEEFRCDGASLGNTVSDDRAPLSRASAIVRNDTPHLMGLCGDCEDRKSCVFPKPEGGIWHCEEYR